MADIVLKIVKVGLNFEGIIDNICSNNKLWAFKIKLEFAKTGAHDSYPIFRNKFNEIVVDINKCELS